MILYSPYGYPKPVSTYNWQTFRFSEKPGTVDGGGPGYQYFFGVGGSHSRSRLNNSKSSANPSAQTSDVLHR
jgi:hypothetical protein